MRTREKKIMEYWKWKHSIVKKDNDYWASLFNEILAFKYKNLRNTKEYRNWRRNVLNRDCHLCVFCHSDKNLEVDHYPVPFVTIIWNKLTDLIWDIKNGRTVCEHCHKSNNKHHERKPKC